MQLLELADGVVPRLAAPASQTRLAGEPSPAGERTARALAGYRRPAADRGRSQARPFGAANLAAVLATCYQPRRRGRGRESDSVARDHGRLAGVIAGLLFMELPERRQTMPPESRSRYGVEDGSQEDG